MMASELSQLRAAAQFNPDGSVVVDSSIMDRIASLVQNVVAPPTPQRTSSRSPTSAAHPMQDAPALDQGLMDLTTEHESASQSADWPAAEWSDDSLRVGMRRASGITSTARAKSGVSPLGVTRHVRRRQSGKMVAGIRQPTRGCKPTQPDVRYMTPVREAPLRATQSEGEL